MKKIILLTMAAGMFIGLSSCKKDYTCTCSFTGGSTIVVPIENASKSDADEVCDLAQTTYQSADPATSCVLD